MFVCLFGLRERAAAAAAAGYKEYVLLFSSWAYQRERERERGEEEEEEEEGEGICSYTFSRDLIQFVETM